MKKIGQVMMPLIPVAILLSAWFYYTYRNVLLLFVGIVYSILAMVVYYKYHPAGETVDEEVGVDEYTL